MVPFVRIAVVAMSVAPAAMAQTPMSPEDEVLRPIVQLFDAMRAKDSTAIRAVFTKHARLVRVAPQGDSVSVVSADAFARQIATIAPTVDERIWDWTIAMDGNVAAVWTKYDVLVNGQFSHCGIDAFQLLKLGGEWKIVQVADTFRRDNCWRYEERT